MLAPSRPALGIVVRELGADGGVLVRRAGADVAAVAGSTMPTVAEGDPWPVLPDFGAGGALVRDPGQLASLTTTKMRLGLSDPLSALAIAPVASEGLSVLLAWTTSTAPDDISSVTSSGAFATFAALAPLLDTQRQAELASARLRAVLGAMGQAVVLFDGGGGPGEINAAAARLLRLPAGYVAAGDLAAALRDLRTRAVAQEDLSHASTGSDGHDEAGVGSATEWVWSFSEDPRYLRVNVAPIPSMQPGSRIWVLDDISGERELLEAAQVARERAVRSERLARESEEEYRLLAENASDVVFEMSVDGRIRWVSPSASELLGVDAADLTGRDIVSLFVPEEADHIHAAQREAVDGRRAACRARYRSATGEVRWSAVSTRPVQDSAGTLVGRVGSLRDIHEEVLAEEARTRSEEEAREANRAKTVFLSRMSHELRTPLNAVIGFAQLLALDPLSEDQLEALDDIQTAGRHLLQLVNEILDISRIEAGRMSLSIEPVSVADAIAEALDLVRPMARDTSVALQAHDSTDPELVVQADRQRLVQALINLLTNAVKYNRPGGSVTVTARSGPDHLVHIEVADTGIGIAPEYLPRLFEPFDRLGAEASDVEGTGIGLALTHGLVTAMGGHLAADSTHGEGSRFTVTLPPGHQPALADLVGDLGRPSRETAATRLLYVEDNPANAKLMRHIVAQRPAASLTLCVTGEEGLQAALSGAHDLVLLDLHLPDLSGVDVLRAIRADARTADLPTVVVTADASAETRDIVLALGASSVITKPINVDEVLRLIDRTARRGENS